MPPGSPTATNPTAASPKPPGPTARSPTRKADGKKPDVAKADGKKPDAAKADGKKPDGKTPAQVAAAHAPAAGHFTLQLSSFADKGDADAFAQKLRAGGLKPQVVRSEVPGKGTFYRVRVGDYASRPSAEQAARRLREKQHSVAIIAPM